jgi:hypothetical protein
MAKSRALMATCLAVLAIPTAALSCNKQGNTSPGQPNSAQSIAKVPMTVQQKQALAYAAQGAGYQAKDPDKAVERFRLAVATEPDNREWQDSLAFALWKDKKTKEAIPIWKQLSAGHDDIAKHATRSLAKVAKAAAAAK